MFILPALLVLAADLNALDLVQDPQPPTKVVALQEPAKKPASRMVIKPVQSIKVDEKPAAAGSCCGDAVPAKVAAKDAKADGACCSDAVPAKVAAKDAKADGACCGDAVPAKVAGKDAKK